MEASNKNRENSPKLYKFNKNTNKIRKIEQKRKSNMIFLNILLSFINRKLKARE